MANRVVMGDRNGVMGMWVSRPGYNVMTAADADMIFIASNSQNTRAVQVAQTGYFELGTGGSIDIVFPYMGFLPLFTIWTGSQMYDPWNPGEPNSPLLGLNLQFLSSTVARFTAQSFDGTYYYAGWSYIIINQSAY